MTVGALLHLGLSVNALQRQLELLALRGYSIAATPRRVYGIDAMKFDVHAAQHGHAHRPFRSIREMLEGSSLPATVKRHAIAIFSKLAEAEGRVHGVATDDVEFHEVGAVDSIIDIVGAAIGLDALGVEQVYVSP